MVKKFEGFKEDVVKIGNVELTPQEVEQYYDDGKYIVTYSRIYKLCYDEKKGYYGEIVIKDNPGMTRPGRFYAMLPQGVNNLMGKEVVKELRVRGKLDNGRKNKMVRRTESKTVKDLAWFKDEINFCLDRFEDSWVTVRGNGNNAWNELVDFRIKAIKLRQPDAVELFKSELAKAVKRKYGKKYNFNFVDTVYKAQNQSKTESKENEYGEKLYKVYVRTGTAWCDVREVYAYNEQEAIDKVVDRLAEEESNLVMDYYELYDLCEVGETVDEFAEANDLICAGNNGFYVGIDRVELAESRKRNKKESTTALKKLDNQIKSYRNNINNAKRKKVTKADIKRMIDYGKAESLDDMSESEIEEFSNNHYLDKIFYAMDINGNSVGAVYIDDYDDTYATTKGWIVNLLGW